jgi:Tfp pilus assembly protein PilX
MNLLSIGTQRGVALVVSMVMLVAITLIGVFVMSGSHLEWLMASNSHFQADAELRAEAALRDGENAAPVDPNSFIWTTNDAFYSAALDPLPSTADPRKIASWDTHEFNTQTATTISSAEYLVEYMGCTYQSGSSCSNPCPLNTACYYIYQIWAHATDSKGTSRIVQSTYTIRSYQASSGRNLPPQPVINTPIPVGFAEIDHYDPP